MLTRLLVSRLLVNIAYIKIWVHLTFVPVHLRKKVRRTSAPSANVSLEPCINRPTTRAVRYDYIYIYIYIRAGRYGPKNYHDNYFHISRYR